MNAFVRFDCLFLFVLVFFSTVVVPRLREGTSVTIITSINWCSLAQVAKRRRRNGFGKYASNRKSSSVVAMHTTQLWHLLYEYLDNNKLGDAAYVLSVLMPRAAYLSAKGSATETAIESCRAGIEVLSKTSSSRSYFSCIRLFNILQMFLRQKGIDLLQVSTDQAIYMVQHRKALEATRLLNDAMLYRKPQDAVEPIWNNSDFQNLSDSDPYDFEDSPSIVSQQSLSQLNNSEVMSAADIGVVRESVSSRVLYGHSGMLEAALWESLTGIDGYATATVCMGACLLHFSR